MLFKNYSISWACLVVLLAAVLAQYAPPLSVLVPRIQQDYVEIDPKDNQYRLRITLPDGSQRDEVTELRAPGTQEEELYVMGRISTIFADTSAMSIVMYEAGKNGYVVKYSYKRVGVPPFTFSLSPNALKTAAG